MYIDDVADEPDCNNPCPRFECKECNLSFDKTKSLKKHIQAVHPKIIKCDECAQTFDQKWKLEHHSKLHSSEKRFQCDRCNKSFLLQWRLRKHIQGHEQQNVKFCHFFNNNKICKFEEVSGCMFRHEHAPVCKYLNKCKHTKCQFSHTTNDGDDESDYDSDSDINIVDNGIQISENIVSDYAKGVNDDKLEQVKDALINPVPRCNYGLCDLRQILFNSNEELKTHLECEHGIFGN